MSHLWKIIEFVFIITIAFEKNFKYCFFIHGYSNLWATVITKLAIKCFFSFMNWLNMIRCLHLSNSRQSQIKITEVWQHSLTVLSRCTQKIDVWILCVTKAGTFDAIVVSKALWAVDPKISLNFPKLREISRFSSLYNSYKTCPLGNKGHTKARAGPPLKQIS